MKPPVWQIMPMAMGRWTPYLRVNPVAKGDIIMAMEKLRPPINAKSRSVASGKTLFWR